MESRLRRAVGIALTIAAPLPARAQLGELPPEPVLEMAIEGVRAEVVVYFPVEPGALESVGPTSGDGPVWTQLLFIVADTLRIGSHHVRDFGPGPSMASWWVETAERTSPDPRALGNLAWSEARQWYEDREALGILRARGVNAADAQLRVNGDGRGWSFVLADGASTVRGRCDLRGERVPTDYGPPAYSTVTQGLVDGAPFWVFSYEGHHVQDCEVRDLEWTGDGLLARSLAEAVRTGQVYGNVQDGWRARAGFYGGVGGGGR